jgi:hypothetical protein
VTIRHRLAQHSSHQRATASAAARAGTDAGAFTDLLKRFGAGLNRFHHSTFADLVAQASRFEVLDDRLLSGFLL